MRSFGVGILAGGKSERMGQDKTLLRYGGETMLEHLTRELSGGELLISAAQEGDYERFGYRVAYDENRGIGPIEGMRRLLAESESEWMFLCAADMPLLCRELRHLRGPAFLHLDDIFRIGTLVVVDASRCYLYGSLCDVVKESTVVRHEDHGTKIGGEERFQPLY